MRITKAAANISYLVCTNGCANNIVKCMVLKKAEKKKHKLGCSNMQFVVAFSN